MSQIKTHLSKLQSVEGACRTQCKMCTQRLVHLLACFQTNHDCWQVQGLGNLGNFMKYLPTPFFWVICGFCHPSSCKLQRYPFQCCKLATKALPLSRCIKMGQPNGMASIKVHLFIFFFLYMCLKKKKKTLTTRVPWQFQH